jgi:hypothetical protein
LATRTASPSAWTIRYAEGKFDQLPALAKDLVAENPKIIVAVAVIVVVAGEELFAAAQATTTIPIVSATGGGDLVKGKRLTNYITDDVGVTDASR